MFYATLLECSVLHLHFSPSEPCLFLKMQSDHLNFQGLSLLSFHTTFLTTLWSSVLNA